MLLIKEEHVSDSIFLSQNCRERYQQFIEVT